MNIIFVIRGSSLLVYFVPPEPKKAILHFSVVYKNIESINGYYMKPDTKSADPRCWSGDFHGTIEILMNSGAKIYLNYCKVERFEKMLSILENVCFD